ncbi:MAG: hypothetical protein RI995_50, partial [Bacteroidota bacterium]
MKKYLYQTIILSLIGFASFAQQIKVSLTGVIQNPSKESLEFVNIIVKSSKSQKFITGAVSNESGKFFLEGIVPGEYMFTFSSVGYEKLDKSVFVGALSNYLDLGIVQLTPNV